jgi:poly-gamma-glutamate synthesis protein (capsule biosynthesis protein)
LINVIIQGGFILRKHILLFFIPVLVLTYLLLSNTWLYQDVKPTTLASGAIRLTWHNTDIEAISQSPEKYLIRTTDGIDSFISLMETRGWTYREQMGAGIVFVKNGQLLTAVSRNYSRYYMVITVPALGSVPLASSEETITITATGDILMHNTVIASGKQGDTYNYNHLFAPIKHLIEEGDYSSINLESAIAGPTTGYTGYPVFNSPDDIANALKNSGFDLVVTASNHTLDRGYHGALRTLDVLRQAGLDTTGTFKTPEEKSNFLIKDIRGVKVGYLAYSYDTNGIPLPKDKPYFYNLLDRDKIISDISALRPNVDLLVLVLHWGVEYSPYPTEQQRKLAAEFFQKGADVILGSHPHVIQPMETMQINGKDKFVIYSMGNSMGNQNGVERNSGVIIKLQFTKNLSQGETRLSGVEFTPTYIHPYYINERRMFRVVPIEATIKDIQAGKDPYLGIDSIPLLQEVLAATSKHLTRPLR